MNSQPTLQEILPAATREVIAKAMGEDFKSALKLPKGCDRYLVARAIDYVLLHGLSIEAVRKKIGLTAKEFDYCATVIGEFRAWEAINKAASESQS